MIELSYPELYLSSLLVVDMFLISADSLSLDSIVKCRETNIVV